jgi:hypothetical protein
MDNLALCSVRLCQSDTDKVMWQMYAGNDQNLGNFEQQAKSGQPKFIVAG